MYDDKKSKNHKHFIVVKKKYKHICIGVTVLYALPRSVQVDIL